ncbi:ultraviolet light resistance protein A [Pseudomonas syringae pv. persicae]|uniref:Ultraviolet light resistance protein A n=1 Tax=Pseudomonas syringae pv. persicae TaxID=237306 RepID=A0AB38EP00_9PSED|nr:RulA [Pseudomonas syringae pv. persicae]SOQ15671.1 ultraviolet light resistance protein A [Pseudomonas syringae pv. persicae]SOQ15943.1 ultraviolet light resistance protein A [Pseudomonas syringae pv. persicae]
MMIVSRLLYAHTGKLASNQVGIMNVKILGRLCRSGKVVPLYTFKIPAGFPNPAADHIEQDFSFDRLMDLRALHIYVAKIDGDSMEGSLENSEKIVR